MSVPYPAGEKAQSPSGREGPDHGPTVDPITRELRRTSVSQLQTADPSTNEGCLRKWWYDKVFGRSEPSTAPQDLGRELHGYMEAYLPTGEMRLPDRIVRNLHFVPTPGPDLRIEHPTIPTMSDGSSGLAHAPLRAAGVPVVGYIDCVHGRLEKRGGADIEDTRDPPGTINVIDWKFMRTMEYAKTGPELVKTIQMAGYGKYRFDVGWPGELVRLAHGYFPEKGRGDLRSIRVDRTTIEKAWEHAESVTRSIRDVARETDPEKVEPNRRACRAFKKLCIHAQALTGACTAGMHNSLRSIVGARTAPLTLPEDFMAVSILDRIRGTGAQAPTPVAVTVALTGVPDPSAEAASKAAALAKLQAEEQELRAAKQFDVLLEKVHAHGMGMPSFAGPALELAQRARPNGNVQGEGQLQPLTIEDPAELTKLLGELDTIAAQRAEAAKNAPPPVPTHAPVPVAAPPVASVPALLPPESPVQIAGPAPATVPTAPAASAPAAEPAKAPRKSRTKDVPAEPAAADGKFGTGQAPAGNAINLLVDCTVDGVAVTSLHGLIDEWCHALANGTKPPSADIRCATEGSPLSFGKWPGALAAFVRETAVELPPGWYSIDSRGGQVMEVVIDALRGVIRASGGSLIRGVR